MTDTNPPTYAEQIALLKATNLLASAAPHSEKLRSLAASIEIRGPDADGLVWLVFHATPGVHGSAMFNLGSRIDGIALQVARHFETARRKALGLPALEAGQ